MGSFPSSSSFSLHLHFLPPPPLAWFFLLHPQAPVWVNLTFDHLILLGIRYSQPESCDSWSFGLCVTPWLRVGQLCTLAKEDRSTPQKDFEGQIWPMNLASDPGLCTTSWAPQQAPEGLSLHSPPRGLNAPIYTNVLSILPSPPWTLRKFTSPLLSLMNLYI